jgi:DNA processing protein
MDDIFWITLSFVKGLGNIGINKLYKQNPLADYTTLLDSSFTKVVSKAVQEQLKNHSYIQEIKEDAIHHIAVHNEKGISVIPINNENYPPLLRLINDPPAILYAKGNHELLKEYKNIAIVGTRNPTMIGIASAKKIASTFAQRGYTIVSGLALGIDTAGHQGALQTEGGKTIAVLAGDLTQVYPAENQLLANEIITKHGLLISESPIGVQNIKGSFVKRDRIQSGLSLGVCPVQTPLKSGTQHTIQYAREHERFLFTPIPLEKEEDAVKGNLELIANGTPVLQSVECYNKFEVEMQKTYKALTKKMTSNSCENRFNKNNTTKFEQGSLF